MRRPYPYPGGKSGAPAAEMWGRLGDVPCFVDPFAGSFSLVLERPHGHRRTAEICGDLDCHIVNLWRSIVADPEGVAAWCSWPVSEADLHARHLWLLRRTPALRHRILHDPDYCDVRMAGWWCWGLCQWIGEGWCRHPSLPLWRQLLLDWWGWPGPAFRPSVGRRRPHIHRGGQGVLRGFGHGRGGFAADSRRGILKKTKVYDSSRGVLSQNTRAYHGGQGVMRPLVARTSYGLESSLRGVLRPTAVLGAWLEELRDRMRDVRLLCRDFEGTLRESMTTKRYSLVGVALDPPYTPSRRRRGLYNHDKGDIALRAREWAIGNGESDRYRIALFGLAGEHQMPEGWRSWRWTRRSGLSKGEVEEEIWFSPNCLCPVEHGPLFRDDETTRREME